MPLSYTDLSTYQLLCVRDAYQMIDVVCADKFSEWNIVDFEKAVVNGFIHSPYDEQTVRNLIYDGLRELDEKKPLKRYLESGQHYVCELFLQVPYVYTHDERPFLLFWAYLAREYGDEILPIEKARCREIFQSVLKRFKMRLYINDDYYIDRFTIPADTDSAAPLSEMNLRTAFFTVTHRNQAYSRRTVYNGGAVYLDKAAEKFGKFLDGVFPGYAVRDDFNIHDLCFAVDSTCTELQRDYVFSLWGVFTGESLTYTACGEKCGVTKNRISACENTILRNVGHTERCLFARPKE